MAVITSGEEDLSVLMERFEAQEVRNWGWDNVWVGGGGHAEIFRNACCGLEECAY